MPEQNQQKNYTRFFTALFVVLLVISVSFVVFKSFSSSIKVLEEQGGESFVDTVLSTGPLQGLEQDAETERINILFLGISGEGYIAGHLTDSIIVASLTEQQDNKSKNLLFSIPRDLWVKSNNSFDKINALYQYGGGTPTPDHTKAEVIKQEVERITGLDIHYTVVVNLVAIQKVVAILGSVTIDGQEYSADQINLYVRERNATSTDFDRMERQQKLLIALLESAKQYNYSDSSEKVLQLLSILATDVSTDVGIGEYYNFSQLIGTVEPHTVSVHSLTPATGLVEQTYQTKNGLRVWTVAPTRGVGQYQEIQKFIHEAINDV